MDQRDIGLPANQMWGLSPEDPGLRILLSSQGSQADPAREKMALLKDITNMISKGPPTLAASPQQRTNSDLKGSPTPGRITPPKKQNTF